jgi:hypothetical protein
MSCMATTSLWSISLTLHCPMQCRLRGLYTCIDTKTNKLFHQNHTLCSCRRRRRKSPENNCVTLLLISRKVVETKGTVFLLVPFLPSPPWPSTNEMVHVVFLPNSYSFSSKETRNFAACQMMCASLCSPFPIGFTPSLIYRAPLQCLHQGN